MISFEMWHGKKSPVTSLKRFGYLAAALDKRDNR